MLGRAAQQPGRAEPRTGLWRRGPGARWAQGGRRSPGWCSHACTTLTVFTCRVRSGSHTHGGVPEAWGLAVSSASRILSSLLPTPLRPVRHTHQDHRDRETWAWTPTPFHVGSPRQPLPAASPRSLNLTARRGLTPSALLSSPGGLSHPQTALRRPFSLLPSVLSGPSSPAQPRDFDFQVW